MSDKIEFPKSFSRLMYALTKNAARNSFVEFLEEWDITEEDYEEISKFLKDNDIKTYC
ncbi:hypothetical protein [Pectobacterium parmentieri]|uniref:hypothetical protein n=1 Tax=Pectobacterium parmentieri TaxID=1905730 RepID=UPI0013C3F4F6|nr:hypothetical protein [Pectobacterium parmentieri]